MRLICASNSLGCLEQVMSLEKRDTETALKLKGFKASEGDHHFFTYHTKNGQKTSVWTKTSHGAGSKTLSDNLVSLMAKQCGLNTGQFKRLVACPLSQTEMEEILINGGRITLK